MAEIRPFCGWRYETGQIGALAKVVAPPCDHISDALRDELYAASDFNIVRLTRNRPEPGDEPGSAALRAGALLRHWKSERVVCSDHEAAIYVLHQEFEHEGEPQIRRGFIARIRSNGKVLSHEMTQEKYVQGRVDLHESVGWNLSPILGFYKDDSNVVQDVLDEATRKLTATVVTDTSGVVNRMWTVTDHQTIAIVSDLLGDANVYIADGHHRFAGSVGHSKLVAETSQDDDERELADFTMMHLVASGDAGLRVHPTHRMVSGLKDVSAAALQKLVGDQFDFESASSESEAWEFMKIDGRQRVLALGTCDGHWVLGIAKSGATAADAFDQLELNRLATTEPIVDYAHSVEEVSAALAEGRCQVGCLLNPPSVEMVADIADLSEHLPPKSTFFYPKTPAGLVFNPVK